MGWTEAVCKAAGWEWCPEHGRPKYNGMSPCFRLHQVQNPHDGHSHDCPFGDDDTHGDVCICGAAHRPATPEREEPE